MHNDHESRYVQPQACIDDLRAVLQGHIEWLVTLSQDESIGAERRLISKHYADRGRAALERSKP